MSAQKVVIPKWMINPEEVTVIEIPAELKSVDTVIIKHKLLSNANANAESAEPNILQLMPRNKSKKLDACINIPEWNEYFARAIKRRSVERQKGLFEEEPSEEESEDIDEDEDDELESEVDLTESEPGLDYEYVHSTQNPNNHLLNDVYHMQILQEDNDALAHETFRQKMMRSPYSNVNPVIHYSAHNDLIRNDQKVEQVADLLDLVEKFEYSKIHRDLKDFQKARRKLVFSTTKLSTSPCFTIAPE